MRRRTPYGRFISEIAPIGRIMRSVSFDSTGCWTWNGYRNDKGYGHVKIDRRWLPVHRYCYEHAVGPIPTGLQIDHLCRNRACVRPTHMEAVTLVENIRRGLAGVRGGERQRAKTHCPQGHLYNEQNTYVKKSSYRACRTCHRESEFRRYHESRKR